MYPPMSSWHTCLSLGNFHCVLFEHCFHICFVISAKCHLLHKFLSGNLHCNMTRKHNRQQWRLFGKKDLQRQKKTVGGNWYWNCTGVQEHVNEPSTANVNISLLSLFLSIQHNLEQCHLIHASFCQGQSTKAVLELTRLVLHTKAQSANLPPSCKLPGFPSVPRTAFLQLSTVVSKERYVRKWGCWESNVGKW